MKKFLLIMSLFLFGVILNANAQSGYEDVVYLKNGSVIRGVIIEQVPNEQIKIQTADGSVFVYKMDEIDKLTKEIQKSKGNKALSKGQFNNPQGYWGIVEAGGGIGVGDWGVTRVSFSMINGYRLMPQFAIGVGVGVEFFPVVHYDDYKSYYSGGTELSLPIFLHFRSDFINGAVTPYAALNIGYNVPLSGGVFRGIMLEPSLGVGFNIGQRNRMTVGVGFIMNNVEYAYGNSYSGYNEGTAMGNALKLKVGLSF